jgi:archaeal cell division control protein 6
MTTFKKNIFSQINNKDQESIFINENVFYPEYFPENISSRDSQIKELSGSLKALLSNKRSNNFLIHGPPGTGKTLVSNFVLKELSDYSLKVKYIYINCIQENTKFSVYSKIISLFGGFFPRRGLASDEVFSRIKELFTKSDIYPVIILDEIDKINFSDLSDMLYSLSRFSSKNKYFTLILITNNKLFINDLDLRTQSSLFLQDLEFKKYTSLELKNILKERIKYGLLKDSITDDLIGYISGFASIRGGDARIAIDLLYRAAKESEKKGFLEIKKDILLKNSELVNSIKLKEKISSLSKEEFLFLKSLKDKQKTNQLEENVKNISQRSVRRYLLKFEKLGIISLEKISNYRGTVRIINLNYNKESLTDL